jgi:hypothetical protein
MQSKEYSIDEWKKELLPKRIDKFISNTNVIERLYRYCEDVGGVAVLLGPSGIGKRSICNLICEESIVFGERHWTKLFTNNVAQILKKFSDQIGGERFDLLIAVDWEEVTASFSDLLQEMENLNMITIFRFCAIPITDMTLFCLNAHRVLENRISRDSVICSQREIILSHIALQSNGNLSRALGLIYDFYMCPRSTELSAFMLPSLYSTMRDDNRCITEDEFSDRQITWKVTRSENPLVYNSASNVIHPVSDAIDILVNSAIDTSKFLAVAPNADNIVDILWNSNLYTKRWEGFAEPLDHMELLNEAFYRSDLFHDSSHVFDTLSVVAMNHRRHHHRFTPFAFEAAPRRHTSQMLAVDMSHRTTFKRMRDMEERHLFSRIFRYLDATKKNMKNIDHVPAVVNDIWHSKRDDAIEVYVESKKRQFNSCNTGFNKPVSVPNMTNTQLMLAACPPPFTIEASNGYYDDNSSSSSDCTTDKGRLDYKWSEWGRLKGKHVDYAVLPVMKFARGFCDVLEPFCGNSMLLKAGEMMPEIKENLFSEIKLRNILCNRVFENRQCKKKQTSIEAMTVDKMASNLIHPDGLGHLLNIIASHSMQQMSMGPFSVYRNNLKKESRDTLSDNDCHKLYNHGIFYKLLQSKTWFSNEKFSLLVNWIDKYCNDNTTKLMKPNEEWMFYPEDEINDFSRCGLLHLLVLWLYIKRYIGNITVTTNVMKIDEFLSQFPTEDVLCARFVEFCCANVIVLNGHSNDL